MRAADALIAPVTMPKVADTKKVIYRKTAGKKRRYVQSKFKFTDFSSGG